MGSIRRPVRAVLFDLGSTLIYENGPWDSFFPQADEELWKVLHTAGVSMVPKDLYGDSGNLFDLYYARHRGDLSEPTTVGVLDELLRKRGFTLPSETLRAAVRSLYTVTQSNWLPEADALPTLRELRQGGFHVGLISNASDDDNTQALVDKGNFRPYLEYIVSSAAFGKRKPHPGIFRSALDHFGVKAEEAVMVGDDYEADILGAHQAGIQSVWITRRIAESERRRSPKLAHAVVSALSEIPSLLKDE